MRAGGLGREVVDLEAFELVFLQRPAEPREYDEQTPEREATALQYSKCPISSEKATSAYSESEL